MTQLLVLIAGLMLTAVGVGALPANVGPVVVIVLVGTAVVFVALTLLSAAFKKSPPTHSDPDVQALLRKEISLSEYAERKAHK